MGGMRVAYTLEQCWHDAPGGTAVAAIEVARRLAPRSDVTLVGVAGRHRSAPPAPWRSPIPIAQLPLPRPLLYESWLRLRRPRVEQVTGRVDLAHATGLVPCATAAPLVVTMHDLAFLDDASRFSRQGLRVMRRSLDVTRDSAAMVITSSEASRRDLEANDVEAARIRVVPLGVDHAPASSDDIAAVRERFGLPDRFVLFVGTLEPRKNLRRLAEATASWANRSSSPGRRVGVTPRWASTATCASSASCRPPSCRRCTPRRPCSPIPASQRASACPWWRRWSRERPS